MERKGRSIFIGRVGRVIIFFFIALSLLFCITWQNFHLYLINKEIGELAQARNDLERSLYLKSIDLSYLKSRERIKRIALEELGMVPVTYRDVKLIVY